MNPMSVAIASKNLLTGWVNHETARFGSEADKGSGPILIEGVRYGEAVAIQSDGKIVVAGYYDAGTDERFAIARYNSDGTLDTTSDGDTAVHFSTDGKHTEDFGSSYEGGEKVSGTINPK